MAQNELESANQMNLAGRECLEKGDFEGALVNFSKALELLPDNQVDAKARLYNNKGRILVRLKRYDDALACFRNGVEIYDKVGNQIALAWQLENIGSVYRELEEWNTALEYYSKSLAIFEAGNDKLGIADQYSNIGYAHFRQGGLGSALQFFEKAKALYDELGEEKKSQFSEQNVQILKREISKLILKKGSL